MKIAVISAAFPPQDSGEADHALKYCRNLAAAGLDVHVLTTRRDGLPDDPGFTTYPLMRSWAWRELPTLEGFLRDVAPEAALLFYTGWIYNHHPMITLAPSVAKRLLPGLRFVTQFSHVDGAPRFRIRLRDGLDVSFHMHSHFVTPFVTRFLKLSRADPNFGTLLVDSDWLLVMSEHQRATLLEHESGAEAISEVDPPPPFMNIVPDVDGEGRLAMRRKLVVADDEVLFVYYGYIYGGKGLDILIEAFNELRKRGARARLLLIGGTPVSGRAYAEKVRGLVKTLGLDDATTFTGDLDAHEDEGSLHLRASDVCVLPFDDGVELNRSSVASAASHGLPIITTRGPNIESAFLGSDYVMLVPPRDARALCDAMETLVEDTTLRRKLGDGAQRMAETWFSWRATLGRTITALGANPSSV